MQFQSGTLRAATDFPSGEYLIELWSPSSQRPFRPADPKTARPSQPHGPPMYEDITFRDLLFDSGYTGGGLLVISSARIRVDNCFFIHFSTDGISVHGGHETFISSSFLGQHVTVGGDHGEPKFTGVGIDLNSNDNVVTDVAVFSAAIGVILRGQANMVTGVHTYNKASFFGGIGIYVPLPGNGATRIDNCYIDYNTIVLEDPFEVHITNAFFLGDGNIVLKSVNGKINGLNIVDNMFSGSGGRKPIITFDHSDGPLFTDINQVVVDRNNVAGMALKSTLGRLSASNTNATTWTVDFSKLLLFSDRISHVEYSFFYRGNSRIPQHAVTSVAKNMVVVRSSDPASAVVSVAVDQNLLPGEVNHYV